MYCLTAVVLSLVLGTCQALNGFLNSEFAKGDPFLAPPKDLKQYHPFARSDEQYDDSIVSRYSTEKPTPPPAGDDNIHDLYATLNKLNKWDEFRKESSFLRTKYADSPKDESHKQLLKNDLNEWVKVVKLRAERELMEQKKRSNPETPVMPSAGFSPYWSEQELEETDKAFQKSLREQATTKKPRFNLQQQRMISGSQMRDMAIQKMESALGHHPGVSSGQMMEMAIKKMENAAMAKVLRNVTYTENNNHRRSRLRKMGRRQNIPPALSQRRNLLDPDRKPWTPLKSKSALGPKPGMGSYWTREGQDVDIPIPPPTEVLENGVLGPSVSSESLGGAPRPPDSIDDGPPGPGYGANGPSGLIPPGDQGPPGPYKPSGPYGPAGSYEPPGPSEPSRPPPPPDSQGPKAAASPGAQGPAEPQGPPGVNVPPEKGPEPYAQDLEYGPSDPYPDRPGAQGHPDYGPESSYPPGLQRPPGPPSGADWSPGLQKPPGPPYRSPGPDRPGAQGPPDYGPESAYPPGRQRPPRPPSGTDWPPGLQKPPGPSYGPPGPDRPGAQGPPDYGPESAYPPGLQRPPGPSSGAGWPPGLQKPPGPPGPDRPGARGPPDYGPESAYPPGLQRPPGLPSGADWPPGLQKPPGPPYGPPGPDKPGAQGPPDYGPESAYALGLQRPPGPPSGAAWPPGPQGPPGPPYGPPGPDRPGAQGPPDYGPESAYPPGLQRPPGPPSGADLRPGLQRPPGPPYGPPGPDGPSAQGPLDYGPESAYPPGLQRPPGPPYGPPGPDRPGAQGLPDYGPKSAYPPGLQRPPGPPSVAVWPPGPQGPPGPPYGPPRPDRPGAQGPESLYGPYGDSPPAPRSPVRAPYRPGLFDSPPGQNGPPGFPNHYDGAGEPEPRQYGQGPSDGGSGWSPGQRSPNFNGDDEPDRAGAHFGGREPGPREPRDGPSPSHLRYIGSAGPPPPNWNWDVERQQPIGQKSKTLRSMLKKLEWPDPFSKLPKMDDFGVPIKWVTLTAANTGDGLARVTDRKTGKNEQHRINGTVYVPVVYHATTTTTTEAPTTTTELTTTADPVMESLLQFVTPRNLKPEDWLAFDVTLNKKRAPKLCEGDGCQGRCHKDECETGCRGDTCASGCIGLSCKAMCDGPGCLAMCIGHSCKAQCKGHSCDTRCIGKGCQTYCNSLSCRYTTNGELKTAIVDKKYQQQSRPIARTSVEDDELDLESSERIAQRWE